MQELEKLQTLDDELAELDALISYFNKKREEIQERNRKALESGERKPSDEEEVDDY